MQILSKWLVPVRPIGPTGPAGPLGPGIDVKGARGLVNPTIGSGVSTLLTGGITRDSLTTKPGATIDPGDGVKTTGAPLPFFGFLPVLGAFAEGAFVGAFV